MSDIITQVKEYLLKNSKPDKEIFARHIAAHFGTTVLQVYGIIKILRKEENFGVQTTNHGYVPSEIATQKDDLDFLSRMGNRIAYVNGCMRPAIKHIRKRWPHGQLNSVLTDLFNSKRASETQSTVKTIYSLTNEFIESNGTRLF